MKRKTRKRLYGFVALALVFAFGFLVYYKFFAVKVRFDGRSYAYLYIGQRDNFQNVITWLEEMGAVENRASFEWLADKMELPANIHPGRYRITNGMNARQIINLIKYAQHEKVKLSYNSQIRDLEEFVAYTAEKLELEEEDLEDFLADEKLLYDNFRLDPSNAFAMLVPGVYEVNWAITLPDLIAVLGERYTKVWNSSRVAKAKSLGYTPAEIITLASIVQSESSIFSEQIKIAGVYFNRLKKDMPLQADPTLKFAGKNYEAMRVLDVDKQIDSPYNTYKYKGLPPGPICLVSTQAIDATLNHTKHKYLYFCARPELNGLSAFSATYEEHRKCAQAYQKALDKLGISR